jgi:hypothetical protein
LRLKTDVKRAAVVAIILLASVAIKSHLRAPVLHRVAPPMPVVQEGPVVPTKVPYPTLDAPAALSGGQALLPVPPAQGQARVPVLQKDDDRHVVIVGDSSGVTVVRGSKLRGGFLRESQ